MLEAVALAFVGGMLSMGLALCVGAFIAVGEDDDWEAESCGTEYDPGHADTLTPGSNWGDNPA